MVRLLSAVAALLMIAAAADAAIVVQITEVHSMGSSNSTYKQDWFELTNPGPVAVDITGWKMDDSSASFSSAVTLNGVSTILPGQSVVFVETDTPGTTLQAFKDAWFGVNVPGGFTIGSYASSGKGVGLSSGGDGVNIFDSFGNLVFGVSFGAGTTGVTFDNADGNEGSISQLSVVGVNGAFMSLTGSEIGSPGLIAAAAIPEPSSIVTVGLIALASAGRLRSRFLRKPQA